MRILLALIGYLSTATVIAASLGLGYLWQSERLSDEKMFRIVALLQDIDVDGIAAEKVALDTQVPPEEPSMAQIERVREIAMRNFEAKQNSLKRRSGEVKHLLSQLSEARERFDAMARELDDRIRRESELSSQESISSIVRDLKSVKPEEAKLLLLRIIDGAGPDPDQRTAALGQVIRLMNAMPTTTLKNILKKFKTQDELNQLHEIHSLQLDGGPQKEVFDEALSRLSNRDFSE